ncbi:MAG: glycogen/starch synthase [Patescibacteria group bacterium]
MPLTRPLRIASIASEVAPYSKTGGLADVTKSLAKALAEMGHHKVVITPYYGFIHQQKLELKPVEGKTAVYIGKKKYEVTFLRLDFSDHLKIYFIVNQELFGQHSHVYNYADDNVRFLVLDYAALQLLEIIKFNPHIIHCHDWQSGLVPNFVVKRADEFPSLTKAATVFTIHNLSYQMSRDWWTVPANHVDDGKSDPFNRLKDINHFNFAKRGIFYANIINTVSERYAEEITTPEYGQGLDKYLRIRRKDLYGIINGIDYTVNNPAFDGNLKYKYDWNTLRRKKKNKIELQRLVRLERNPDIPLIGIVNRLSEQKGFNLIMETMDALLRLQLQIVIIGTGHKEYVDFFKKIARKHPKKIGFYTPFTEDMESKIYAGSDMFLMPSRFEPCGISQLKSLRYGSIPIVHETGGLSDTITNFNPKTRKGNGFTFKTYSREDFLIALTRALENYKYPQVWEFMTWNAMRQTYSWELPAKKYIQLFRIAINNKRRYLKNLHKKT